MHEDTREITEIILKAQEESLRQSDLEPEPTLTRRLKWPIACTVGPGLEGAIACESEIGYVNGSKGHLIYRGYNIYDLCAYSTFEEVSYLLLHGNLPTASQLATFKKRLAEYRDIPETLRLLMGFPVEDMNTMEALRLGTSLMRREFTFVTREVPQAKEGKTISADEDSIAMETVPRGEEQAIYEFKHAEDRKKKRQEVEERRSGVESCYHLIAGVATVAAAVGRLRAGQMPISPDPELSHAANFLYMLTGRKPSAVEERLMDVALILHADHGMNASTFAAMVVASTLSDFYMSVGAGIAALNGPLHGGANEQVMHMLEEIGSASKVKGWYKEAREEKRKIMGFGHRVYKAYDPRARVLGPLAKYLALSNKQIQPLLRTAAALEKEVVSSLGASKGIYPNVDFYSGIVYSAMGIPKELFTPVFAVSRVSGWTARILEYLQHNRIFRPRAMYVGPMDSQYVPMEARTGKWNVGRKGKGGILSSG